VQVQVSRAELARFAREPFFADFAQASILLR
jgi:hypothetical protein